MHQNPPINILGKNESHLTNKRPTSKQIQALFVKNEIQTRLSKLDKIKSKEEEKDPTQSNYYKFKCYHNPRL